MHVSIRTVVLPTLLLVWGCGDGAQVVSPPTPDANVSEILRLQTDVAGESGVLPQGEDAEWFAEPECPLYLSESQCETWYEAAMYALDRAGWITGCTEFEDIVQSITSFDLPDEDFDPARYAVSYFMNNQYLTWGFNAGLANIFFHEAYHIMYGPAGGEHHAESIGDYCSGYRLYT